MRSNGLATVLLLIPILAIPAVAIFGIPQITPLIESTFGEPREDDFQTRTGDSSRSSRDDLFGDIEGFGSDSDFKDDLSTKRQEAISMEGKSGASAARRKRDSTESKWDDELDDNGKRSEKWPRRQSSKNGKDRSIASASDDDLNDKLSDNEQQLRQFQRQQSASTDELAGLPPSKGMNRKSKADVEADDGWNDQKSDDGNKRSRSKTAADSNRADSNDEPLTLNAAFERLNELDIRSYRLEPGKEVGQFVFICSYTPENTPRVSYRFEASSDEPLKAVLKVLSQISEWQQRQ